MEQDFKLYFKIKDIIHVVIVLILLVFISITSYWLGTLNGQNRAFIGKKGDLSQESQISFSSDNTYTPDNSKVVAKTSQSNVKQNETTNTLNQGFVASKNGTKYYPNDCAGAKRIKLENQIIFITAHEAEDAGYEAATNC